MLTEQEQFWAGEFGDGYTQRCDGNRLVANNVAMLGRIMESRKYGSAIEFGANVGLNLEALHWLNPEAELAGIEINESAAAALRSKNIATVYEQSILDFVPDRQWDLVLVKGVLIHINPDRLSSLYDTLYKTSGRYICLAEYFNPTPVEVPYRGHSGKLFKRDFAGEMLDRFSLKLVDYFFTYSRDRYQQDNITTFLLEKQ